MKKKKTITEKKGKEKRKKLQEPGERATRTELGESGFLLPGQRTPQSPLLRCDQLPKPTLGAPGGRDDQVPLHLQRTQGMDGSTEPNG